MDKADRIDAAHREDIATHGHLTIAGRDAINAIIFEGATCSCGTRAGQHLTMYGTPPLTEAQKAAELGEVAELERQDLERDAMLADHEDRRPYDGEPITDDPAER